MKRSIARWTTTLAAATIVALPVATFAQTAPQTQPPAQTEQQPAPQTTAPQAAAQQTSASDDAAKIPLTAARNSLSQLTQLPAASQLQGETRAQVSQLIANFNELITTKSDWKASYAKVEANLSTLLGQAATEPERASATPGAVGTSGTATLDPAIRAKLVEFRQHLDEFEKVVNANTNSNEPGAAPAPAAAAPATAAPTSPTTPNPPETPATPTPETPTPAEPRTAAAPDAPAAVSAEELMEHVDAIESILSAQTGASAAQPTGAATATQSTRTPAATSDVVINQTQMEQLKAHLAEMRRLLEKK
jgi:hypothetical protein